jgi:hypothetical protein
MLLLAHLALRHEEWSRAKLRVLVSSESEEEGGARLKDVEEMLAEVRIAAEAETHVGGLQPLIERSRESHLVFLPMVIRRGEFVHPFGTKLDSFLGDLPVSALVLAAEDVALDVDPDVADEGKNQEPPPA